MLFRSTLALGSTCIPKSPWLGPSRVEGTRVPQPPRVGWAQPGTDRVLLGVGGLRGDDGVEAGGREGTQLFPHGSDLKQGSESCSSGDEGRDETWVPKGDTPPPNTTPFPRRGIPALHSIAARGAGGTQKPEDGRCQPPRPLRSLQMGQLLAW